MSPRQIAIRSVVTFVSLAGVATALTWLFLGMRAVMRVGGSCGSGGPYQIATPCPQGVPFVMLFGIFGGIAFLTLYGIKGLPFGPRLALLAWPALFLSLGWNFFEFGVATPGLELGWLFCAVVFGIMGGAPLLLLFRRGNLRAMFAADGSSTTVAQQVTDLASSRSTHRRPGKVSRGLDTDDLPSALERMAALHASGKLTDDEFAAAKRRLLGIEDQRGEA
jgi:hypothetical protein